MEDSINNLPNSKVKIHWIRKIFTVIGESSAFKSKLGYNNLFDKLYDKSIKELQNIYVKNA